VEAGGFTQILLNVTPSEVGDFDFKVKAESTSDPKTYAISTASIHVEGVSNHPPVCACLTPDKPESEPGKVITWTTCTIDPEGDPLEYRFLLKGPNHKDFDVIDKAGRDKLNVKNKKGGF